MDGGVPLDGGAVVGCVPLDGGAVVGCVPLDACPACFRVCLFDDHDRYRFVDGVWGTDGRVGAMGDAGRLVCDLFRGRICRGSPWICAFAGLPAADPGGGRKVGLADE